jgi:hypothetical protein
MMLETLKFVMGAVSKKDHVPELTHFHIANSRISGYNGKMRISAPIALDIDCCPKADQLVKAINACDPDSPLQVKLTPTGKLSIHSGKFRALVDCVPMETYPDMQPGGTSAPGDGLLSVFTLLYDYTSDDVSRPWASGVLVDGQFAYATNNVIFAQAYHGQPFPYRVNIPRYAVKELARIGEECLRVQLTANTATFHFADGRWLMTQLVAVDWPAIDAVFARMAAYGAVPACPQGLWDALDTLAPFVGEAGRVYAAGGSLTTTADMDVATGAVVDVDGLQATGIYNHKMLSSLRGVALQLDFEAYPAPMTWYGVNVAGLFVGMRA